MWLRGRVTIALDQGYESRAPPRLPAIVLGLLMRSAVGHPAYYSLPNIGHIRPKSPSDDRRRGQSGESAASNLVRRPAELASLVCEGVNGFGGAEYSASIYSLRLGLRAQHPLSAGSSPRVRGTRFFCATKSEYAFCGLIGLRK